MGLGAAIWKKMHLKPQKGLKRKWSGVGVALAQSSYDRDGKGVWQGESMQASGKPGSRQLGLIMFMWILAMRMRVTEL